MCGTAVSVADRRPVRGLEGLGAVHAGRRLSNTVKMVLEPALGFQDWWRESCGTARDSECLLRLKLQGLD